MKRLGAAKPDHEELLLLTAKSEGFDSVLRFAWLHKGRLALLAFCCAVGAGCYHDCTDPNRPLHMHDGKAGKPLPGS